MMKDHPLPSRAEAPKTLRSNPSIRLFSIALVVLCLAAACGSSHKRIKGEPPLTSIDSMERNGDLVLVDLAIRNINDRSIEFTAIEVDLTLADVPLGRGRQEFGITVSARSREVVRVALDPSPEAIEVLEDLARGNRAAVTWQMNLVMHHPRGGSIDTENDGWLHPVPGQPDRFR